AQDRVGSDFGQSGGVEVACEPELLATQAVAAAGVVDAEHSGPADAVALDDLDVADRPQPRHGVPIGSAPPGDAAGKLRGLGVARPPAEVPALPAPPAVLTTAQRRDIRAAWERRGRVLPRAAAGARVVPGHDLPRPCQHE